MYLFNIISLFFRITRIFTYFFKNNLDSSNSKLLDTSNDTPTTIISWNIQELFLFLNSKKLDNVIDRLRMFSSDIICLQEVFEDKTKRLIIDELKNIYPYYLLGNLNKKYLIGEDSGLLVLSKFPIKFIYEYYLTKLALPDSFANKSILYFTIGNINFATTHLQSTYEEISKLQLKDLINNSPFKDFIIVGDLNNRNTNKILNVKVNNICNTFEDHILDYILPYKCNFNIEVKTIDIDITNTSDHMPIIGKIIL